MIKIKRLTETAKLPEKAHADDAGYDIFSDEDDVLIQPKTIHTFSTGIIFILPEFKEGNKHIYLRIAPKSGLAVKKGIDVFAGVVDAGYRGELKICLFNASDQPVEIKKGDKLAQAIPTIIYTDEIQEVDSVDETDRGASGFGSTGR